MKKRLTVLLLAGILSQVIRAQSADYLTDSLPESSIQTALAGLCQQYRIPKPQGRRLKELLSERERRKSAISCLHQHSSKRRKIENMRIDSAYQDSIDLVLMPYNRISGENISFAIGMAKAFHLDKAQYDYIARQALDMAHDMRRTPGLNVWNREMQVLKKTMTAKQLSSFFYQKNGVAVGGMLKEAWSRLQSAGLTEELDSARECARACLYYHEYLKICDLYKHDAMLRKRNLAELANHMPLMVRMDNALTKQERGSGRRRSTKNEYVW